MQTKEGRSRAEAQLASARAARESLHGVRASAQLAAARASRIVRELMAQGVSAEWAEEYLNARARAEKEFGRKLTPAESRAFRADFLREAAKLREADARAEAIVRAAERADDRPEAAPDSGAA